MKASLALTALLLSGSAPDRSANDKLMDEIERQVRLPAGAEPLNAYGRYYAFDGKRRVTAAYLLPPEPLTPDPRPADWGCEEVVIAKGELSTREVPCGPDPDISRYLRAGQRRWMADRKALPFQADGGCSMVHVRFDLKSGKIDQVYCNGSV